MPNKWLLPYVPALRHAAKPGAISETTKRQLLAETAMLMLRRYGPKAALTAKAAC
ncbi:hypothetical protein HCU01_19110 [Halomonas cupida]|uniref:Uncharacterized protein n=1 Tax=Halomonas cupida TaxID=44933 RepID=A0ABQ0WGG7_9GAMM|nr:hypothetical protein HCU01_19110 [Halomonas cupida]